MRQIIGASPFRSAYKQPSGCVGTFWDNDKKCQVRLDLGYVAIRVPFVFRAAASGSSERTFEGVEAVAQNIAEDVRVLCNTRTSSPMGEFYPRTNVPTGTKSC